MKPERIEELRTLAARWMQPEEGTISCAIKAREAVLVSLEPAELLHLLRCARAWAELDRAWNYRIQKMREGVLISFQGIPEKPREESEGPDLLTATEAALARAKETPDAT